LARKRVLKIKAQKDEGGSGPGKIFNMNNNGAENYDNPDDIKIREQLGDFDYGQQHANLGKRERRYMIVLENRARYEGEWIIGSNVR
jgi:hypothetical protein